MNKYQRLKHSARNSARRRGHNLTRFKSVGSRDELLVADATCKNCTAGVRVILHPASNCAGISSTAIELPCNGGQA